MLQVESVSKHFGKLAALSEVSFEVNKGEIFGIAGPNGAGKSTLFNVIAGLYRPSAGRIIFEGHDITRSSSHAVCRRGIARTFQIPATFHTLTIYDNIRVGATFGAGKNDHIGTIIDFLGLQDRAQSPARSLDLYTTKLVMLGATLATNCRLLMLDEPMAGLSIAEINNFLGVVRRINQKMGITVVIIEHLLDILIGVTGRMMILHDGKVLFLGPSEGVARDRRVVEIYLGGKGVESHA